MAFVLDNVLGYLRVKNPSESDNGSSQAKENEAPKRAETLLTNKFAQGDDEEETDWIYDIEDRGDWQIVRKMDEELDNTRQAQQMSGSDDDDLEEPELDDEGMSASSTAWQAANFVSFVLRSFVDKFSYSFET